MGKERKIRVLFVYSTLSSFVRKDLEILQKYFDVKEMKVMTFLVPRRGRNPLVFLKLIRGILWADIAYCWFANLNTFFATLFSMIFRKKSIVIVGGYDAAYVPEINYGIFTNRWSAMLAKFVYKHVDKILVVDESLKTEILRNTGLKIENKIKVVPTGYDYNFWKPGNKKEDIILTVGNKPLLKGLDTFSELAKEMPERKFIAVGFKGNLNKYMTDNIEFVPHIPQNQLLKYYQRAKVFCLFSRHEGLPNVLCEAMLCECVPVGTKVNGIITAIDDTGFLVDRDVKEIKKAVEKAMVSDRRKCRERIKKLFPLEKRKKELIYHIKELLRR